jgi:hypothetical protein
MISPAWLDAAKPLQADNQDVGVAREDQPTSAAVEPPATPLGVLPAWLESLRPSDKAPAEPVQPIASSAGPMWICYNSRRLARPMQLSVRVKVWRCQMGCVLHR